VPSPIIIIIIIIIIRLTIIQANRVTEELSVQLGKSWSYSGTWAVTYEGVNKILT